MTECLARKLAINIVNTPRIANRKRLNMGFVLLSICVVILLNIAPMSEKDYIAADYSLSAERQEKPVSSVN